MAIRVGGENMAGFGGAVKLTGESEYRNALKAITQELKEVDSELKLVASQYDKNDNSQEAIQASTDALTKKLSAQAEKVKVLKDNYKSLQDQAENNKKKHAELKDELDKESQKLSDIEKTSGKTSNEYKTQAKIVSDLASEYKKSTTNINNQESALSKARIEINNAETAYNNTAKTLDKLDGELNDTEKEAKELGTAVKNAGDEAEKSANGGFTVLKGVLANLASSAIQFTISSLKDLVGEAIDASDALKKFETTMGFAGYDSSTIEKAQADVKDYADKTVYDLQDISNTTAQLAANSVPDFMELTKAAGNLNAVAGGNKDTFKSVAMVMTQTAGAGKLTTENWNQLANAIPGASGKLQEALKKNKAYTGDFREAMAKGEITAEEFNAAIMELGNDPVAVEAAQSVSTFEGAVGNLQATVVSAFLDIYNTIGQENITSAINGITALVNQLIPPLVSAVSWFITYLPAIAPLLAAIAGGLTALLIAQKIQAMVAAFQAWKLATEGQTVAQALLNTVMNANPIMVIVTLIGALVTAILYLWNTNEDFREYLTETWESIKEGAQIVVDALVMFFTETLPNAFKEAGEAVGKWFGDVVDFFKRLPGEIWTWLQNAIGKVRSWGSDMVEKAKSTASDFFEGVLEKIKKLPNKLAEWLTQTWLKVKEWSGDLVKKGKEAAKDFFDAIKTKIEKLPGEMLSIGREIVSGIWNGLSEKLEWLKNKITGFGNGITSKIKSVFGISSPSKVMRDEVGKYLAEGVGVGFTDEMRAVSEEMQNAIPRDFDTTANFDADIPGGALGGNAGYNELVRAFREALEGVDVELDDQKVGRFVRKTVTDAIYN